MVTLGRPYLMPPGVPADRVAIMRKAFADTFDDPGFRADANRMSLGVTAPKTGAEVQKLIEDAYRTPAQTIARLRKLSLH
jgi:tripartite-type tricarboxylate transporter receptor subunit TctC